MNQDTLENKFLRLKQNSDLILQKIEVLSQDPLQPDWISSEVYSCLENIKKAAKTTIERATSPTKIGVLGEFSSGKSLLIGSLCGYGDVLPVSSKPTTGNVTVIRFFQQSSFQTTKISKYKIEYLSHQEARQCLQFMLKEAVRISQDARLSETDILTLSNLNTNETQVWNDLLKWIKRTKKQILDNKNTNLDFKYLLNELESFALSYIRCGKAICGSVYSNVDRNAAIAGLELSETLIPSSLWDRPLKLEELSAQKVKESFSLIRRIEITVEVSKEIWNFSSLQGNNEFLLLDFPGLGASKSAVRDTFLSLQEMAEVQTILILLNSQLPESDRANKILTIMQQQRANEDLKDRILVGVGRFDQVSLSDGGLRILNELVENNDIFEQPLLEETEVLQKLEVLDKTIKRAQEFTKHPNRIFLLSPFLKLAQLDLNSGTVQYGSSKFLDILRYENFLKIFEPKRQAWLRLSQKVLESNPHSNLGKQIKSFAEDGGVNNLAEGIKAHVKNYGLEQLYKDTETADRILKTEQKKLSRLLEAAKQSNTVLVEENQDFIDLRQSIRQLIDIYGSFKEKLEKRSLTNLIGKTIVQELTLKIYNWRELQELLDKIENDVVKITLPETDEESIWDEVEKIELGESNEPTPNQSLPIQTNDFYHIFELTLKEIEDLAKERVQYVLSQVFSEISDKVNPLRHHLMKLVDDEIKKPVEQKFGTEKAKKLKKLKLAINLDLFQKILLEKSHLKSIDPESVFPLAKKDEQHKISQIFDWAAGYESYENKYRAKDRNDLILILRLRDEIVATTKLHLFESISEVNQTFNTKLIEILSQSNTLLVDILQDETLLKFLTGSEDSESQWLKILSEISSINHLK